MKIAEAINEATCDTANAAAIAALEDIKAYDVEYDKITQHGQKTIVSFDP